MNQATRSTPFATSSHVEAVASTHRPWIGPFRGACNKQSVAAGPDNDTEHTESSYSESSFCGSSSSVGIGSVQQSNGIHNSSESPYRNVIREAKIPTIDEEAVRDDGIIAAANNEKLPESRKKSIIGHYRRTPFVERRRDVSCPTVSNDFQKHEASAAPSTATKPPALFVPSSPRDAKARRGPVNSWFGQ